MTHIAATFDERNAPQTIRAEIFGDDRAELAGGEISVRSRTPVLELCRFLIEAGWNSPLIERKKVLAQFLEEAKPSRILLSEHFEDGAMLLKKAAALSLEGIVSKRADAPYRSRRDENWIKVKCLKRGTFVIVGFVPTSGGQISKLRVARREGKNLYYAGRASGGLSVKVAQDLRRRLEKIRRETSPLTRKISKSDTVWVEPVLAADVEYTEMTADGSLRHPIFKGLVSRAG